MTRTVLALVALLVAASPAVASPIVDPSAVINLTRFTVCDPVGHITALTPTSVTFESVDGHTPYDWSGLGLDGVVVPESATYLMFEIVTLFSGEGDPQVGNVNVMVGDLYRYVQGTFAVTLAIPVPRAGSVISISVGFPGGVFQAGEFMATVSGLRFVDDATLPEGALMSYSPRMVPEPSILLVLGTGLVGAARAVRKRRG